MGGKKHQVCDRGHSKGQPGGANHKPKDRGVACRACECALSYAYNVAHRKGIIWTERDLQAYADIKFEEFSRQGL